MRTFKVLPLFIIVAFLSLSVRFVQVVDGVAFSVHSEAHAGDEKPAAKKDEASAKGESKDKVPDSEGEGDQSSSEDGGEVFGKGDAFPEWRDPADDDPSYMHSKMKVLDDLSERRAEIDERERVLENREALLRAAEQELGQKYRELDSLRGDLKDLLKTQSKEEQARIESLVKIYEGMKPKDAARIFDTLDLDILVEVVAKMSTRKLSPVLAAMDGERARTLTIMLAEQKQLPSM